MMPHEPSTWGVLIILTYLYILSQALFGVPILALFAMGPLAPHLIKKCKMSMQREQDM